MKHLLVVGTIPLAGGVYARGIAPLIPPSPERTPCGGSHNGRAGN